MERGQTEFERVQANGLRTGHPKPARDRAVGSRLASLYVNRNR